MRLNNRDERESQAGHIAEDREFAAEIRREYRLAAGDYCLWPDDSNRNQHRSTKKMTAGAGVEPAPE